MATSKIGYGMNYESLTLDSDVVQSGSVIIQRVGILRFIFGDVRTKTTGTNKHIVTLASGDRPPVKVVVGATGYSLGGQCEAELSPDGSLVLHINSSAGNNGLKFGMAYAVSDAS